MLETETIKAGHYVCPLCKERIQVIDGKTKIERQQYTRYMKEVSYPQINNSTFIEHEYINGFSGGGLDKVLISYGYTYSIPVSERGWHFHWIPIGTAKQAHREVSQ